MLVGKHPVISDMGELDTSFQEYFDINYRQRPSAEEILYMDIF